MASSTKTSSKKPSSRKVKPEVKPTLILQSQHGNCSLRSLGPLALSTEEASLIRSAFQLLNATRSESTTIFTRSTPGLESFILTFSTKQAELVTYLAHLVVCDVFRTLRGSETKSYRFPDRWLQWMYFSATLCLPCHLHLKNISG